MVEKLSDTEHAFAEQQQLANEPAEIAAAAAEFEAALETDDGKRFRSLMRSLNIIPRLRLMKLVTQAKREEPTKPWLEIFREILDLILEYLPLFLKLFS